MDGAEDDAPAAMRVNEQGAAHIAISAAYLDVPVIHFSTDYVFDGGKGAPYTPDDPIAPLSVYGRSKAAGETAVCVSAPKHFIVRTAWLYGPGGNNFPEKMLRLAAQHDRLRLVEDEIGSPTHTRDLAEAACALAKTEAYGTYHAVNAGACSRLEFATEVFRHAGVTVAVTPCAAAEFPTKAGAPALLRARRFGPRGGGRHKDAPVARGLGGLHATAKGMRMKRILVTGGAGLYRLGIRALPTADLPRGLCRRLRQNDLRGQPRKPARSRPGALCLRPGRHRGPRSVARGARGLRRRRKFRRQKHTWTAASSARANSSAPTWTASTRSSRRPKEFGTSRVLLISTDEVYGSIAQGAFPETAPLNPRNPYSAAKAGGELLGRSYFTTFGLPVIVTRGSNTYGPYQYPEKVLPLFVTNAFDNEPMPLYRGGERNVRDWLYVDDHCSGIDAALRRGEPGEIYNIAGGNERENIVLTRKILELTGRGEDLIRLVPDRPGHDYRYAIDAAKIRALGWQPQMDWDEGMRQTVQWYRENESWWRKIKSGEFRAYYERQYGRA